MSSVLAPAQESSADGETPAVAPPPGRRWLIPPRVSDIAISVMCLATSVLSCVQNWEGTWSVPPPVGVSLVVVASLMLVARRRFPASVAALNVVIQAVVGHSFGFLFALYALGAYGRNWWAATAVMAVCFGARPEYLLNGLPSLMEVITSVLMLNALPFLLGLYVGSRRTLLDNWADRAQRAEREQALIADRTRSEERTRMAREMHDSIAHQLSLVALHAGALQLVAGKDPAKAATAATTIEKVSRDALDELREMIGVLRARPTDDDAHAAIPKLDELDALVGASREAGLPVQLAVDGQRRPMPDTVERAAYRVVQEALTNVHKHAGAVSTTVHVSYGQSFDVTVRNAAPDAGFQRSLPSGGQGLIGLGERVNLAGGTLRHGATRDGGFQITASFAGVATPP